MKFRSIAPSLAAASILFILDALVLNQGAIALIILFVGTPYALIRVLMARKNPALRKLRAVRSAIYIFASAAVIAANSANNALASKRAEAVIAACDRFKSDNGRYPEKLAELVPEYLTAIPKAKMVLTGGAFKYSTKQESHLLIYHTVPPFGRMVYNLESKSWSTLD